MITVEKAHSIKQLFNEYQFFQVNLRISGSHCGYIKPMRCIRRIGHD